MAEPPQANKRTRAPLLDSSSFLGANRLDRLDKTV